jgi:hypothetical protein
MLSLSRARSLSHSLSLSSSHSLPSHALLPSSYVDNIRCNNKSITIQFLGIVHNHLRSKIKHVLTLSVLHIIFIILFTFLLCQLHEGRQCCTHRVQFGSSIECTFCHPKYAIKRERRTRESRNTDRGKNN